MGTIRRSHGGMDRSGTCFVCNQPGNVTACVVEGAPIALCAPHARRVTKWATSEFSTLSEFFATTGLERRVGSDRRRAERRMFPPRPESRRQNQGRRVGDPRG